MSLLLLAALLFADSTNIAPNGIGPFRAGTTLFKVAPLLNTKAPQGNDDPYDCAIYPSLSNPRVLVMIQRGYVVRASIDGAEASFVTATGVSLGSSEELLKEAYGDDLIVKNDPYGDHPGDRLYYLPGERDKTAIRFTVHGGLVTEIIAGERNAVQMPEGCM